MARISPVRTAHHCTCSTSQTTSAPAWQRHRWLSCLTSGISAVAALLTDEDRRVLRAQPMVLTASRPTDAILSYARDVNADLIVMGTHGRTGVAHLFMGSVAEHVVRAAPCPVLTVRHPEREFVQPDALQVVAPPG
jgi:nucleotide-binding universal stress UspA family protein